MKDISNMKNLTFRTLVNSQLKEIVREHLMNLKHKHSKLNKIGDSYSVTHYNLISPAKISILLKFRTRIVAVKSNFKSPYGADLS